MGWIEGLNDAMDYIEANLEGDLDLAHAARLAACTEGQFRRMFSYIAGIGLGEYVRRRRISRAALDLSRGERVVDVAVRYGYCSPTAFNRAFRVLGRYGEYYRACRARGMGHGRALKAVARKRLRAIYAVMRDRVPYRE